MKTSAYINNTVRFIILLLIQGLVFQGIHIQMGLLQYAHFIIYPLYILLAPLNMPRSVLIISAFFLGLGVDFFYNSPGVHASAAVFVAYIRVFVLKILEPYEGYAVDISPSRSNLKLGWFLSYSSILMMAFFVFYFSVEAFSIIYYSDILLRSIFSFFFSMVLIILHQFIFKTKY